MPFFYFLTCNSLIGHFMFVFRTHRCTSRSFTYFSLSLADDRKILKKISVDLFFDLVPTRLIYLRKFLLEINELK